MNKEKIIEFIRKHDFCVLSTVNENGSPESAVMAFSENNKFELLIATGNTSRKFKNILTNPNVSVVIGGGVGENITVQYEGKVRVLEGEEMVERQKDHFKKLPESLKYKDNPNERYLLIEPKVVRYSNCEPHPWDTLELSF